MGEEVAIRKKAPERTETVRDKVRGEEVEVTGEVRLKVRWKKPGTPPGPAEAAFPSPASQQMFFDLGINPTPGAGHSKTVAAWNICTSDTLTLREVPDIQTYGAVGVESWNVPPK